MTNLVVKVPVTCERTGKQDFKEMSLEEAQKYTAMQAQRASLAEDVLTFLNGLPEDTRPDLVISFRGKSAVLSTVLEKRGDAAIRRALHELAPDAFPAVASTPRKKKTIDQDDVAIELPSDDA